jgi:chemotaxis protein MotA
MRRNVWGNLLGLAAGLVLVLWAHRQSGGSLDGFVQWPAMIIVGGGTVAALCVSYPVRLMWHAVRAVIREWADPPEAPDRLVPVFMEWATRARRTGLMAVEREIAQTRDGFLKRALTLTVSGVEAPVVRQTLEIDHRVSLEREEEYAQVFEAAGGYAPTLGIVAAVLGLMRAMQDMSSPAQVGAGIASAFVSTIYGLGVANLIFLPLATRLRTNARLHALRREFTIEGVLALHGGLHPRMVEERLNGYVTPASGTRESEVA